MVYSLYSQRLLSCARLQEIFGILINLPTMTYKWVKYHNSKEMFIITRAHEVIDYNLA